MTQPSNLPRRSRSYLEQLEAALKLEFPPQFPLYLEARNMPAQDAPPRVVWYPVIGEIREPTNGVGSYHESNDPDNPDAIGVTREVVGERQLNLAFEIWAETLFDADLLVNAVYSRIKRVVPRVVRAQEQWLRDDQQTTLGNMVTLLISVPVPVADDDEESAEVLASVVASVRMRTEPIPVSSAP